MPLPTEGWKNKVGTAGRSCACGSWAQHYANETKVWPKVCSIYGCANEPTLGAHVINAAVSGEFIVASCDPCNKQTSGFSLKPGISVASANQGQTCAN